MQATEADGDPKWLRQIHEQGIGNWEEFVGVRSAARERPPSFLLKPRVDPAPEDTGHGGRSLLLAMGEPPYIQKDLPRDTDVDGDEGSAMGAMTNRVPILLRLVFLDYNPI
jgi:hypothetical protein